MRRFQLTGPEVFVGGVQFSRLEKTILVREGKVAVLADDDPRCDDLARSPFFEEVDEAGEPVKNAAAPEPVAETPAPDEAGEPAAEKEVSTTRRPKASG